MLYIFLCQTSASNHSSCMCVDLLGPSPHLSPLALQPPHALLSPLGPHLSQQYDLKD